MAITDYIWPFEKDFSQIPCAREASIAALLGGPGLGAVSILLNKPKLAFRVSINSGFVIFWASFMFCRYRQYKLKSLTDEFKEAYSSGKLD